MYADIVLLPFVRLMRGIQDNLVQACSLAGSQAARGRGVLVVLNDRISSGYYVSKVSANRMDTFRTHEQGQLGIFANYTPHFFYEPARPTNKPYFDIGDHRTLPFVVVVYCYVDIPSDALDKAASDPLVEGIVLAGFGDVSICSSKYLEE